jgi:hypothetical protein
MKWKYISSMKTRIYPERFPNGSTVTWSLVQYSKRETSQTKLKTSQSVMILVVRLGQLTDIVGLQKMILPWKGYYYCCILCACI